MKNIELFPADRNEKKQADIVDIVETAMFFFTNMCRFTALFYFCMIRLLKWAFVFLCQAFSCISLFELIVVRWHQMPSQI